MSVIRVSGPQGSGKTVMVETFVVNRCTLFGNDDVLRVGYAPILALPLTGHAFHTVVCDGRQPTDEEIMKLRGRLLPGGVIVVVTDE